MTSSAAPLPLNADSTGVYRRHLRVARNRSMFREINERTRARGSSKGPLAAHSFVCECRREDCDADVQLSLDECANVRSGIDRFAVLAAHADDDEQIVEQNERYVIVDAVIPGRMSSP